MKNDLFLKTIAKQPVSRTPVWLMRQAGRYLPEYRAIREKMNGFMALCQHSELAAEVTLQPIRRFSLDAAIIFSDILIIPDAMGLSLKFVENEGPVFDHPILAPRDIVNLPIPDPITSYNYLLNAISRVKKELHDELPLIGFCGSPWTLATYMLEGRSTRDFQLSKKWLYNEPGLLHQLLAKLSEACYQLLSAQIEAGANAVMIFDTWGGILSPEDYRLFSLHYLRRIVAGLKQSDKTRDIPVILFSKQCAQHVKALAETGCDVVGLDWTADLNNARKAVGEQVALQGNLDPAMLLANESAILHGVETVLSAYGNGSGHIFNLGHGVTPEVSPEKVAFLVETVSKLSPAFHSKEKVDL